MIRHPSYRKAQADEMLLLALLATVAMLFAAFTAACLVRRTGADWRAIELPGALAASTAILLASSATLEAARRTAARPWLLATLALGAGFVVAQVGAWRELAAAGLYLETSPHAAFLYVLTAVHGAHLLGGIGALAFAAARGRALGLVAAYWHFMAAAWLYILFLLRSL